MIPVETIERHIGANQRSSDAPRANGWSHHKVHPEGMQQKKKSRKLKVAHVLMILCIIVLLALSVTFIILYVLDSQYKDQVSSVVGMSVCWKPLVESSKGFSFRQEHVTPHIGPRGKMLLSTMPTGLPPPQYNYTLETELLIERLQKLDPIKKAEIPFFDGKLNIAFGLLGNLLLGQGVPIETMIYHSLGETGINYDTGIVVWNEKVKHNLIRPTTVIQELFPNQKFLLWDGLNVSGRNFQPYIRVMPHSEYPSGSSCICQGVSDYVEELWPSLGLVMGPPDAQGNVTRMTSDNVAQYPIILPNTVMPVIPGTNDPNPSPSGYTTSSLNERCGDSRTDGGMHFTASVPDGRKLCRGMGTAMAKAIKTLIPSNSSITYTAPCNANCINATTGCLINSTCTDPYETPWFPVLDVRAAAFNLPDANGSTASDMPYTRADRNHLLILGVFSAITPTIVRYETPFQFRITNTIDNIVWNCIAAFTSNVSAVRFGQTPVIGEPVVRNTAYQTTDARVMAALHGIGAALPILMPAGVQVYHDSLAKFTTRKFSNGFNATLEASCKLRVEKSDFALRSCVRSWVEGQVEKTPEVVGNAVAFELMYHKIRDGWNSLGTEGGCSPENVHFCPPYADTTGYKPESGTCTGKSLRSAA